MLYVYGALARLELVCYIVVPQIVRNAMTFWSVGSESLPASTYGSR